MFSGAESARERARQASTAAGLINVRRHKPDYWIIVLCAILLAVGLVVIYSISPALALTSGVSGSYFVDRQALAIGLSIIAFIVTTKVPLERFRSSYKLLLVIGALATLVAIVLPVNPNYPAHRWVRLGSLSFESVELLKFALLVWLANFLTIKIRQGAIANFRKTAVPILASMVVIGFVVAFIQSDLGSTGVIVAMMGIMAFIAGLPIKRILIIGGLIIIVGVLAVVSSPYRRARIETYLHPAANCQSTGYQACQSIIAVGSGGLTGLGLGSGVQAYGYLPEADNDSIFAIYAEKFGFIGSIILLAIFAVLFYRIAKVSERAPDDFSRLVVVGVLTWISVETIINIGAMVGLLPLKGITLPFISYGGTSLVFFAAAMGLVYQISGYSSHVSPTAGKNLKGRSNDNDYSSHGRGVRGSYYPNPGNRSRA